MSRMGMKLEDVEKVLGGPPGWQPRPGSPAFASKRGLRIEDKGASRPLLGRDQRFFLLDDSGTVIDKDYCPGHRQPL